MEASRQRTQGLLSTMEVPQKPQCGKVAVGLESCQTKGSSQIVYGLATI